MDARRVIEATKSGWNINSAIAIAGFAITFLTLIFGGGRLYEGITADLGDLAEVLERHEVRLTSAEASIGAIEREQQQHAARITRNEEARQETGVLLREMQRTLTALSGDSREMRAILERVEKQVSP